MDEHGVLEGMSANVSRANEKDTNSFPEACTALFRLLLTKAQVEPNLDVLDIGSGCGDSTHLLSQQKTRSLKGVTSSSSQVVIARRRFPGLEFIAADAVAYLMSLPDETVDLIFALDCAYHFSSRKRFLQHCARVLRSNGRIAMTDLILGDNISLSQSLCMRFIALLTGAPYSNFKAMEEYRSDFIQAGFVNITIEDISENVFPGLQSFIHRHHEEMTRYDLNGKWTGYMVFAKVLTWWWTSKVVRFIAVKADTGSFQR